MRHSVIGAAVLAMCLAHVPVFAQTGVIAQEAGAGVQPAVLGTPSPDRAATSQNILVGEPKQPSLFKAMGHDFANFFSPQTAKVVGAFAVASLAVARWDRPTVNETREMMSPDASRIGNFAGSLFVQAGAGFATQLIGQATKKRTVTELGNDLVRAQFLSQ